MLMLPARAASAYALLHSMLVANPELSSWRCESEGEPARALAAAGPAARLLRDR